MALNFPSNPLIGDAYTSGNTTWQYDGVAWNVIDSSTPLTIPNSFGTVSVDGQSSLVSDRTNDTLNFVAGDNITLTTDDTTDSITINSTATGGGGGGADQNLWATVAGDSGSVTANTTTDTLTIEGGTNITTVAANDTVTVNFTGTLGSSTFAGLTEVATASLNISKIYMPAAAMYTVDNSGTAAYTFLSHYSGNNPTIYALSGTTIAFDLTGATGHPFQIQDPTSLPYSIGLVHVATDGTVSTGADAQGKDSGVLYWQINETVSGTYRYQCLNHIAMVGGISITRLRLA
jgi:plastocyanin